jgi:hypothetical protein
LSVEYASFALRVHVVNGIAMPHWQYRAIDLADLPDCNCLDLLNKLGEEGWELVIITANSIAHLRRRAHALEPSARGGKAQARGE